MIYFDLIQTFVKTKNFLINFILFIILNFSLKIKIKV